MRLKLWHCDGDCKGHISVTEEMLKCDVWCNMWFCILQCVWYTALWCACQRKGVTRVRQRHWCMKKIQHSAWTEQDVEKESDKNKDGGSRNYRRKSEREEKKEGEKERERGREREREREWQKVTVSNCPWHKSCNWCRAVKNTTEGNSLDAHTHTHTHTHTHKIGYREIRKTNKHDLHCGNKWGERPICCCRGRSLIKHNKKRHDNNCVCLCVCGGEAPWISELQSEIEKFKPSHGSVPSDVPLIRRHHPVRAFKPPPPQNVQRDRRPTSALWTTQRRTTIRSRNKTTS